MAQSERRGITRVEVLVLIGIFTLLVGLLLPACRNVRTASARVRCQNGLKQLMLASYNYKSANGLEPAQKTGNSDPDAAGLFPPGCLGPGTVPEERLSWIVLLLPYIEQDSLYRQLDLDKG